MRRIFFALLFGAFALIAFPMNGWAPGPPCVDIVKYVSVDGGTTWHDANTVEVAPTASNGAIYKLIVRNCNPLWDLQNVTITDDYLEIDVNIGTLDDDQLEIISANPGFENLDQQSRCDDLEPLEKPNIARVTATANYSTYDPREVTDTDPAWVICEPPACDIGSAQITANCESYTLTVNGNCEGVIDYELTLTPLPLTDPPTVGIIIKDSFVFAGAGSETISVSWEDLSSDGLNILDVVQSGGTFELAGEATLQGFNTLNIEPVEFGPCGPPPAFCEDGLKPQSLNMKYTGDDCSATSNTQEGKVRCDGDPAGFGPVFIVAASKDNLADSKTKIWFSGSVEVDDEFVIDAIAAGKTKLDADTRVFIFDSEGGTLLQFIKFHTSCSKDLNIGDQFGSLVLEGGFLIPK